MSDREERVARLVMEAHDFVRDAAIEHIHGARNRWGRAYKLNAIFILYSGGNDSTVLAHLFRNIASHAVHANTGIGVEETRVFVRDTCRSWQLPLLEEHPPVSYEELVIERGFPGPGQHWKMYQRLKERCFDQAKQRVVTQKYGERTIYLAGRRAQESERRKGRAEKDEIKPVEIDGSTVWLSPLLYWTALDLNTYRDLHPDCPRNPVADCLHMSGECLCGAFAHKGELDEIDFWYPAVAAEIRALEARVTAAGNAPAERCRWGWGADRKVRPSRVGRACSSCSSRWLQADLFELVQS